MKSWFALFCSGLLFVSGCSKQPYENRDLPLDSSEAQIVRTQLATLRAGGQAGVANFLRDYAVTDGEQFAVLKWSIEQLATADTLELQSIDQFGEQIVRVVIRARRGSAEQVVVFLLIRQDDQLRWAGPN